jgi:plasmid stabilization system protein ParE
MTRRLVVRPQARLELADASDWYDAQDKRLADDLLFAFEETISTIVQNPFQYQVIRRKTRRASLGKFPYGLIYSVSENDIVILSCFHGRRNPKRWQRGTK